MIPIFDTASKSTCRVLRALGGIFRGLLLALIQFYQSALSPLLPASCRFYPSCSEYGRQALEAHGAMKGSWLTARRICRCHPWHPGGTDPVPMPETHKESACTG